MGAHFEFNYILRLRPHQGLDEASLSPGTRFSFEKTDHRIYPLDVPIELANEAWEIIGRVSVWEITIGGGRTRGICEVLLIYSAEERALLTRLNQEGEQLNTLES